MEKRPDAAAAAAPAAAGEKKEDFAGAFSEFAKAKTDPGSASPSDAAASAAAGAEKKPDEAKPDAAAPDTGAAAKPADGAAAAPATVDAWKDAPQVLRDAHERELADARRKADQAEQKAKSAEGRYKAANSKASELERKLASGAPSAAPVQEPKPQAAPAAAAAARPAPESRGEAAAAAQAAEMPPEWKQLQETLPDVAKAVEARFGAVDLAVREALAAVKPVQEAEAARFAREQATLLDEAYPGWNNAVRTPEFNTWIKQQPQSVRELARSDYAADNAALLEYYGYQPPEAKPQPAAQPGPGGKTAAQIQAERDQRLERGTSVRNQGNGAPLADAPDNFESAFAFYARKRQEAARRSA
jgi:hypothetical protein